MNVRVALWDVRAQWESGLRTLTVAQSCLDQWPVLPSDDERQALLATLQDQVSAMREVNASVRQLLADVGDALEAKSAKAD